MERPKDFYEAWKMVEEEDAAMDDFRSEVRYFNYVMTELLEEFRQIRIKRNKKG